MTDESWFCPRCPSPKPSDKCQECPRNKGSEKEPYHFVDARLHRPVDIVILAEAQISPRIINLDVLHTPFGDDAGKLLSGAIGNLQASNSNYKKLLVSKTYVALCSGDKVNKTTQVSCSDLLQESLSKAKPRVIVTMGSMAIKALGIKAKSVKELHGKVVATEFGGQQYLVVPTISTKQLISMPGIYNIFYSDLRKAFNLALTGELSKFESIEDLTKDYIIPKTLEEVEKVVELIEGYSENGVDPIKWAISTDSETNTRFPHRASLKTLCVSFAWGHGKATAIPLWHPETPYNPEDAAKLVGRLLAGPKPKVLHHGKFDVKVFKQSGFILNNWSWDTMLGEHNKEEDKKGYYGLKEITASEFPEFAGYADTIQGSLTNGEASTQLDDAKLSKMEKRMQSGGYENVPLDKLLLYAAIDTDMTRRIAIRQYGHISREENLIAAKRDIVTKRGLDSDHEFLSNCTLGTIKDSQKKIMSNMSVPLAKELANIELNGIKINRDYLQDLYLGLDKIITSTEEDLQKMVAGSSFTEGIKLNHAGSIAKLLFEKGYIHPTTGELTKYEPVSYTKKGQAQTTSAVLKHLVTKYECPFSAKKLIYAKAYKAKNTFCHGIDVLSALDGYVHTSYNQHGTGTYRLSSSDMNMQNIPPVLANYIIKALFTPDDESYAFVNTDVRGAEVTVFTAYSHDAELIRSLKAGQDTHCFIACKVIDLVKKGENAKAKLAAMGLDDSYPLTYADFAQMHAEDPTMDSKYAKMLKNFRKNIKRVVFGILYGAGPSKIAETAGISLEEAKALIEAIFSIFPSIPRYMDQGRWEVKTFGTVETYFGRRRRFPIKNAPGFLRGRAERQANNFKIQSTSSDIVMSCLLEMAPILERDLGGRLLLTVHDSLGFQLPKKYLSQLPPLMEHLENYVKNLCPWLPVDFKWDYEVGNNYGELMPLVKYQEGLRQQIIMSEAEQAYTEEERKVDILEELEDTL